MDYSISFAHIAEGIECILVHLHSFLFVENKELALRSSYEPMND